MNKPARMSRQTRTNWLIDAAVFASGLLSMLSGVYFLYMPSGGNPGANVWQGTILFVRDTWSDVHQWAGIAMIIAVVVHFAIHWGWVTSMAKRLSKAARGQGSRMSRGAKTNLAVDIVIAISFLVTALSGLYFLFGPSGGYQGGRNPNYDPGFLFSRTTWDLIHTWAGVTLIVAAVLHFAIHWRWITKVTAKFFRTLLPSPELTAPAGAGSSQ